MLTAKDENAFTLIELVIAMIIASAVFAIAGQAVISMFASSSSSQATREAASRASVVLEQFDRDVRYARSPLAATTLKTKEELRSLLLFGSQTPATCDIDASSPTCQWEEVTVATPTQLWLRSDVLTATSADAGVECVVWSVSNAGLRRTVHRAKSPTNSSVPDCRQSVPLGAEVESKLLLKGAPAGVKTNAENRVASFGYTIVMNPFVKSGDQANPKDCETRPIGYSQALMNGDGAAAHNVRKRERMFISTISLDLTAFAQQGKTGASRDQLVVASSPISRSGDTYAFAAGCSYS